MTETERLDDSSCSLNEMLVCLPRKSTILLLLPEHLNHPAHCEIIEYIRFWACLLQVDILFFRGLQHTRDVRSRCG